ncbi:hypothetical protein ACI3PL_31875, partial [Lacticaseibacillus paracasei]
MLVDAKPKDSSKCPEINVDSVFNLAAEMITPNTIITERWHKKEGKDTAGNWLVQKKQIELQETIGKQSGEIQVSAAK